MPDKCARCGKELEKHGLPAVWICEDHGENWRWRPCKERVDYWANNMLARCNELRFLFSEGADNVPQVSPATCASCLIPDAMRAKRMWDACGEKLVEAVKACNVHRDGGPGEVAWDALDAALAAVEKAEEGGSDAD